MAAIYPSVKIEPCDNNNFKLVNGSESKLDLAQALSDLSSEELDTDEKEFTKQLVKGETPQARVCLLQDNKAHDAVHWRNGLGVSTQLVARPSSSNSTENFLFRLIKNELFQDRASLLRYDGCDVTILPLPMRAAAAAKKPYNPLAQLRKQLGVPMKRSVSLQPGQNRKITRDAEEEAFLEKNGWCAILQQNDRQDHMIPLNPLSITTYDGAIPTTMHVQDRVGMRFLTLIVNRQAVVASTNVYTVSGKTRGAQIPGRSFGSALTISNETDGEMSDDVSQSGDVVSDNTSQTSVRNSGGQQHVLSLCDFAIVYAIKQDLRVKVEQAGQMRAFLVKQDTAMLVERSGCHSGPIELLFSHVTSSAPVQASSIDGQATDVFESRARKNANSISKPTWSTFALFQIKRESDPAPKVPFGLKRKGSILILEDSSNAPATGTGESVNGNNGQPLGAKIYHPPNVSELNRWEMAPSPSIVDSLVIEDFPLSCISSAWVNMVKQGLGEWVRVPVLIARGAEAGPVVGITAVVHGNELNGLKVIHHVLDSLNVHQLKGTIVAVPCVNVPGFLRFQREFSDGKDLNRLFPGCPDGTASQVYCFQLMNRILQQFHYHIDLHTASFGRINSYYVRSDMNDPASSRMAVLMQSQVILHNSGQDGTLRSAASARGVRSITVEIGNPQLFQNHYIQWAYAGLLRIFSWLEMLPVIDVAHSRKCRSILCSRGFWIYTNTGGILEVYPEVGTIFRQGDVIATIRNIFGTIVDQIVAPSHGIAIGKSSNPVVQAGDRVIHVGVIKKESDDLAKVAKENY